MIYGDDPQDVIFNNRAGRSSLDSLGQDIVSLARSMANQRALIARIEALERAVALIPGTPVLTKQVRALDTDFVIDQNRNALVFYTIELTATGTLTGTSQVSVDLLVDTASISTIKNLLTVTLSLGSLIGSDTKQKVLVGYAPAKSVINLASSSSGGGSASIIQASEVLI